MNGLRDLDVAVRLAASTLILQTKQKSEKLHA